MTAASSIRRVTIVMALLVLLSKIIGFAREVIIASRFGTGIAYDTYLIAVSLPVAVFSLLGYAFSNLYIPQYSHAFSTGNRAVALARLWSDVKLALLLSMGVMVLMLVAAGPLLHLIAPGLDPRHLPRAVFIMRVSSVIIILGLLEAFFRSVLNAEKQFLMPAVGPVVANTVMVAVIVLLAGQLSIDAILYGLVFGYAAQAVVVGIPFVKTGMMRSFSGGLAGGHTDRFFESAVIVLAVAVGLQLYTIVDRYFASSLEAGIVSALGYAILLVMLAVDICAYAFSTAAFPYLTDAFADKDEDRTGYLISQGISAAIVLAVPITMIFWMFSRELALVLFRRGAFDDQSVLYTSRLMQYFALSLTGQFLVMYMSRVYYAARRAVWLAVCMAVALAVKILLAAPAVAALGYIGLPLSSSLSYSVAAVLLIIVAGRTLFAIDWAGLIGYVGKVVAAAAVAGVAATILQRWLLADRTGFAALAVLTPVAIIIALAVFAATAYGLNIPEARRALAWLRRRKEIDDDRQI